LSPLLHHCAPTLCVLCVSFVYRATDWSVLPHQHGRLGVKPGRRGGVVACRMDGWMDVFPPPPPPHVNFSHHASLLPACCAVCCGLQSLFKEAMNALPRRQIMDLVQVRLSVCVCVCVCVCACMCVCECVCACMCVTKCLVVRCCPTQARACVTASNCKSKPPNLQTSKPPNLQTSKTQPYFNSFVSPNVITSHDTAANTPLTPHHPANTPPPPR